jgi:DNA-binding GntR family transcriptional regulator
MITSQELLPGMQLRQSEMAEKLHVSTIPLREALKILSTDNLLTHVPNQGYFVAILDGAGFSQIYWMREILEAKLLSSLIWPDEEQLAPIRAINEQIRDSPPGAEIEPILSLNREFHFKIFDLSPLDVVQREVRRLWAMVDSYRAVYMNDDVSRVAIVHEHDHMIDALERHDRDALIHACEEQRAGLKRHLSSLFSFQDI